MRVADAESGFERNLRLTSRTSWSESRRFTSSVSPEHAPTAAAAIFSPAAPSTSSTEPSSILSSWLWHMDRTTSISVPVSRSGPDSLFSFDFSSITKTPSALSTPKWIATIPTCPATTATPPKGRSCPRDCDHPAIPSPRKDANTNANTNTSVAQPQHEHDHGRVHPNAGFKTQHHYY